MPTLRPRSVAVSGYGLLEPFACAQVAVGLRQLANRREQQPDREIGDLLGQDVGRVRHDDAAPAGLGCVDGVVADAEIGDDLELRQPVHEGAVDVAWLPVATPRMRGASSAMSASRSARFPGLVQVKACPMPSATRGIIGPGISTSMFFTARPPGRCARRQSPAGRGPRCP